MKKNITEEIPAADEAAPTEPAAKVKKQRQWKVPRKLQNKFPIHLIYRGRAHSGEVMPLVTYSVNGVPQFYYVKLGFINRVIYKFERGWEMKKTDPKLVKQIGRYIEKHYFTRFPKK